MKKSIITLMLLFIAGFLFAQDEIFKASWLASPVKIDGLATEWSNPLRYYDADTKLFFAFANDDKNLYLCFQTNDNNNEIKIMHAGMEISLTTKAGQKVTIGFPLPQTTNFSTERINNNDQQGLRGNTNDSLTGNSLMELKGFATKNGMIVHNDSSGVNAAIRLDENKKLTYEIVLPLKEVFGLAYSTAELSKNISLSVKINAMKGLSNHKTFAEKDAGAGMGSGNGKMGSGMQHRHGQNAPGEGEEQDGSAGEKTNMDQKTSFKQKFVLAQATVK